MSEIVYDAVYLLARAVAAEARADVATMSLRTFISLCSELVEAAEEMLKAGAHAGPCTDDEAADPNGENYDDLIERDAPACVRHLAAAAARRRRLDQALEPFRGQGNIEESIYADPDAAQG